MGSTGSVHLPAATRTAGESAAGQDAGAEWPGSRAGGASTLTPFDAARPGHCPA
jgi:hypothetical protein